MQELPTDFFKLFLLLPLRLLKHMSRRHVVSDLLLGAFSFPSLQYLVSLAAVFWMSRNAPPALRDIQKTAARETIQYPALIFFVSLFYLNMRSVCITMISDFHTLKGSSNTYRII